MSFEFLSSGFSLGLFEINASISSNFLSRLDSSSGSDNSERSIGFFCVILSHSENEKVSFLSNCKGFPSSNFDSETSMTEEVGVEMS